MTTVRATGLVKAFGAQRAVDGINLAVESGELVCLLGPSGCGKTTTLRCIAGLEIPTAGEIRVGDQVVAGPGVFVPPERRNIGMVFQSYAIWPHMSVFENVAYGLRLQEMEEKALRERVAEVLELVGLTGLEKRMGTDLSGGQQQRVAVARSVVIRPEVLLFDEPLSNLDAQLRTRMRGELRRLQRAVGITSIYVTHDQEEAMAISDRIVLMNHGRIEQEGLPFEIRERPRTPFAAGFLGSINWFDGVVAARKPGAVMVVIDDAEGLTLTCTTEKDYPVGTPLRGGVRPEQVRLRPLGDGGSAASRKGAIRDATYLGTKVEALVEVGKLTLQAAVPPEEWLMDAAACKGCLVELDQVRVHLFPQDSPALVEDV